MSWGEKRRRMGERRGRGGGLKGAVALSQEAIHFPPKCPKMAFPGGVSAVSGLFTTGRTVSELDLCLFALSCYYYCNATCISRLILYRGVNLSVLFFSPSRRRFRSPIALRPWFSTFCTPYEPLYNRQIKGEGYTDNVVTGRSTFQAHCQQEFRGTRKQVAGLRHIAHEAPALAPSKEASVHRTWSGSLCS